MGLELELEEWERENRGANNPQPKNTTTTTKHNTTQTGAYAAGLWTEEQRFDVVRNACPGAGACGGMYTANTMASSIEAMGMALPYSSSIPAEDPLKLDECRMAGKYILELMKRDIKPKDIMTRTVRGEEE